MFVYFNKKIINSSTIASVSLVNYEDKQTIKVFYFDKKTHEEVKGIEATELLKKLYPELLSEKEDTSSWTIHNMIGHPLMQICNLLGNEKLANKIHDITIPK